MTRALLPDNAVDLASHRQAIRAAMDAIAKQAKAEFEKTTATWNKKPDFAIESPSEFRRLVGTDDEIYGYVNDGTRPHLIVPHGRRMVLFPGGQPKTAPRVISSGTGSPGQKVFTTGPVHHPGTEPREFDEAIAEELESTFAEQIQRAIDGSVE